MFLKFLPHGLQILSDNLSDFATLKPSSAHNWLEVLFSRPQNSGLSLYSFLFEIVNIFSVEIYATLPYLITSLVLQNLHSSFGFSRLALADFFGVSRSSILHDKKVPREFDNFKPHGFVLVEALDSLKTMGPLLDFDWSIASA